MIKETMIELLVLSDILDTVEEPDADILTFKEKEYDLEKIADRFDSLMEEFLEPYVIDSTSSE